MSSSELFGYINLSFYAIKASLPPRLSENFILYLPQGPSASAYVTYIRSEDALRAIQCVNNVVVDGRTLKVTH